MFDNFKFGGKKEEEEEDEEVSSSSDVTMDEKMTGKGHMRHDQHDMTSAYCTNATKPIEEPKRSLSVALADVFRRPSAASSKSRDSSPQRKSSTSSIRKLSIFQLHNPNPENDAPRNSSIRKLSIFQSHNPDPDNDVPRNASIHSQNSTSNNESADLMRKGSYIPRNAAASFLKTAAGPSAEEREKRLEEAANLKQTQSVSSVTAARKASLAMSDTSEVSAVSGRRPSGAIPNNVASRYMRSASLAEEEQEGGSTTTSNNNNNNGGRRRSTKSRQGSNGDGSIKPVALAPELHAQWQNSVTKALRGGSFQKAGDTAGAPTGQTGSHRMKSLAGIADVSENVEAEEAEDDDAAVPRSRSAGGPPPSFSITPASPPASMRTTTTTKKGSAPVAMNIDTAMANDNQKARRTKVDSGRDAMLLADQVSPRNVEFRRGEGLVGGRVGQPTTTTGPDGDDDDQQLESLGFRGAVPA